MQSLFASTFKVITSVKKYNKISGLSKGKYFGSTNDEAVLISAQRELEEDDVDIYEVSSITSLAETEATTVIVDTGSARFVLEIDQHSGKIINKEKLIR